MSESMLELLKLYRERDARDEKIRNLEDALSKGGDVHKLKEMIAEQQRTLEENAATIHKLTSQVADKDRVVRQLRTKLIEQESRSANHERAMKALNSSRRMSSPLRSVSIDDRQHAGALIRPHLSEDSLTLMTDDGELQRLQEHIVAQSIKLAAREADLQALNDRFMSLEDENLNLQNRIKSLEDETGNLGEPLSPNTRIRVAELEAELAEARDRMQQMAERLAELDESNPASAVVIHSDVQVELERLKTKVAEYQDRLAVKDEQSATTTELQDSLDQKISETAVLRAELSVAVSRASENDTKLATLAQECKAMEATLQERTAQVQQAAAQLLELERQLESSAASAHSAQGTAQHNITALRQAVADSQGELETVRGEADAKDVTLLAAKEQICVLQEDNVRHAARLQELEKEREQIVAEFDARVKAASAEAQQTSFSQQETRWKSEVEQLRAAHAQCEVTIAEARKSFEKSLTASQAELSTMKLELEKARTAASESSNSTPQVEKLQAELAKAKEQTSKYEKTLEDCTKKIQTLEKDCSQSSQDSTQLKDNLEAHLKRAEEAVAAKAIAEKAHQAAVAHHSQSEDAIRAKLTEQQDTNAAALKDVQEKDQKIAAAETERKQLAGQLHDAQMQLSYARNHETDLEKKVKSLTSRSNELEIQVKTLTVELDKQSKNVTESPSRSASKSSIVDTTELPPARPLVLQDTISDAFSAIEDRDAACRFWVYALYDHDPQSQIPQNDVYMAYVKDYKSTSKPRLKASEFFQVCKNMYEGVAIKNRPAAQGPNGATQVEYLVSGLARRHIHKLPLGQAHAPAAPETPTLPAEPSPVKQEMLATVTTLDAGAAPVVHKRTKPWDAKANLDFKMWLRFTVLGVSTAECTHFASSSAGACKRYSFAKHKIQILRDKGWALQGTEFVVPADSTHFRHACFDLNTILEVIGVAPKLYDADLATFVNGAENAPALSKWVDNPDDPELLAKFGHLTRPEIDDHKANPAAPLRPAGLEPTDVKKNRKTKRERDTDGNEDGGGVAKRPRPSSSALPTKP